MTTEKTRIYNFDYLRFVCAAAIALHHYQQVYNVTFENGVNWYGGGVLFGCIVELFFTLSGFLLSRNTNENKGFFINVIYRWLRIFPYAFVATLSSCVVYFLYCYLLGTNAFFGHYYSIFNQIASLLLVHHGWFYEFELGVNNPTWYLCVLLWINILYFGLLHLLSRITDEKKRNLYTCIISVLFIVLGLMGRHYKIALPFLYHSDFRGYSAFFIGVLLGRVDKIWKNRNAKSIFGILALFLSIVIISINGRAFQSLVWLFLVGPGIIILLANIRQYKGYYSQILGGASFEVYLWHVPVYYLLKLIYDVNGITMNHTYCYMIIVLLGIEIFSTVYYCKIEKPLSEFINRKVDSIL